MNCYGLSPVESELLQCLFNAQRNNTPVYLAILAMLCSSNGDDGKDFIGGYSRGDFKRAIRGLRIAQREKPEYTSHYHEAISFIRREWLQREVAM